ncbi:MAG: hypothetical protein EXR85_05200 [Xanthomonadales bacterium]|nr:hypothetical protein [Xanthomonadales bacterium]
MNVFTDPELFLNRYEEVPGVVLGLGDAQFIRLNERELRRTSFLDHRELNKPVELRLGLEEFARQAEQAAGPQTAHAFGMIYHSAFCCSTHLARCLDATGMGRSLKEPYALTQASFYFADETYQQFENAAAWDRFLRTGLSFLVRPGKSGRLPVIKTHNFSIVLTHDIARLFPGRAKGVFIYSDLQSFLTSTLKSAERRNFCRLLLKLMTPAKAERLDILWIDPEGLPDPAAAAYCWLMHLADYACASALHGPGAFRSLDCDVLLDQPAETLLALADYFAVETSRQAIVSGLEDPAVKAHAKNPARAFSAQARRSELQTQGFHLRGEIREALRWFDRLSLPDALRSPPAFPLVDRKTMGTSGQ